MTLSEPAATIDGMTNRDDEFADAPAHIREHARKVRAVQDASRAQETERKIQAIESARAGRSVNETFTVEGTEYIATPDGWIVAELRREPFDDGWDKLPQTPSNGLRFYSQEHSERELQKRERDDLEGPDTRDLRLRIVSQLGEAPTISAELTDLHAELQRIESFCEKFRRAFGLPPR